MAGKRKNRDENGAKLPWRPPGAEPAHAREHPHQQERTLHRHMPYQDPTSEAWKNPEPRRVVRKLEKEAFPVSKGLPARPPNPRLLTDAQLVALVKKLEKVDEYDWKANARPEQLEPLDYTVWLLDAGRGFGKTRTGAETVRDWTENQGLRRIAVIAKASRELRDVCFEGVSGLNSVYPPDAIKNYYKGLGDTRIELTNGAIIIGFTAESPDSIRGHAFDAIWGDEFAAWPKEHAQDMYDQAWFCMRESKDPRMILTTTPKRVKHLMDLLERAKTDPKVVVTTGKTSDNTKLSKAALAELYARYAGTHQGRQELEGELLMDVEGALWVPPMVEAARFDGELPTFRKVIIGVDPSGSATGDATGIVAIGYTSDKRIYVLGCYSTDGLPAVRYGKACRAAQLHRQPKVPVEIVVEYNHGGDNTIFAIDNTWKHLVQTGEIDAGAKKPLIKKSTLKGSKAQKAGPVAGLYEQQVNLGIERIWHLAPSLANGIDKLENEQLSWAPTDKASPNSLDAFVVAARRAMLELGLEGTLGTPGGRRRIDDGYRPFG